MAQIYNMLFKAPTALTSKTTLHSHHIGAAALDPSTSEHSLHSQGYKATGLKWFALHMNDKDRDAVGFEPTTTQVLEDQLYLQSLTGPISCPQLQNRTDGFEVKEWLDGCIIS